MCATLCAFTFAFFTSALGAPPAFAAGPPLISNTAVSAIGQTTARLEGTINPNGRKTEYHFEYVDQADFEAQGFTGAAQAPSGGASIPIGTEGVPVPPVPVSGLNSTTTYHYRLVASSTLGITEGPGMVFMTYVQEPALKPCPFNEPFRTESSVRLPDCRAYEQVSPVVKNGADINGSTNEVQAAGARGALTYFSAAGLPGATGAQEFETLLSRRGQGAWSTEGVYPPASAGPVARNAGWTPELSQFFSNVAPVFSGPWTFRSRSGADGSLAAMSPTSKRESFLVGASTDGSKVYFQNNGQLDPITPPNANDLYLWDRDTETVKLVGLLPDSACGSPPCQPAGSSLAGANGRNSYVQDEHAISSDGSRAYFTDGGTEQLYLREGAAGPAPETVHVSAPQRTIGPDPAGTRSAAFMAATPDGSKAFFTSAEKLTDDATTAPEPALPLIGRANIVDGGEKKSSFLSTAAVGIAIASEHIYWANPVVGAIGRAKLNGAGNVSEVENEFITGIGKPRWLALDGEYVYWTDPGKEGGPGEGSIGRAKLDHGEPPEPKFIPGKIEVSPGQFKNVVSNPQGIAVNSSNVFWANDGTNAIARANINGTSLEPTWHPIGGSEFPQGVALNATQIYWTTNNPNSWVARADLDGSNEKFISVNLPGFQPAQVRGIALDDTYAYWVRRASGDIGRAKLDLTEPEEGFISAEGNLAGLAADAEHIYWSANGEVPINPGNDLYRFDADTGKLADITVDTKDVNGAEVAGVLGTSTDGSYVYYAASGDLDGSGPAVAGDCHSSPILGFKGECNLYLWHDDGTPHGATTFIVRLDANGGGSSDAANWIQTISPGAPEATARVSANGQAILFRSQRQLTSYDNQGVPEFYLYRLGDPGPTCVSCTPTGLAPVAAPTLQSIHPFLNVVEPPGTPAILTRNLSANGNRVFFESSDKLVSADTNGEAGCQRGGQASAPSCQDVYEWEANGSGSCESAAQNGGCLYLLSSGTGTEPSFFADASAAGEDALIFTRDALVPQDRDQIQDAYDARVDGGLASQHAVAPPPCEGVEACHDPPGSAPAFESPQTPRFNGPGNLKGKGCPKGKHRVRRHGKSRCVAKKPHIGRSAKKTRRAVR